MANNDYNALLILSNIPIGKAQDVCWEWQSSYPQGNLLSPIATIDENSANTASDAGTAVEIDQYGTYNKTIKRFMACHMTRLCFDNHSKGACHEKLY